MRNFILVLTAFILSSCNMLELAQKVMPDKIEAMAERDIDALYAKSISNFQGLQGELSEAEFETTLNKFFAELRGGKEYSRDLVGATSNTHKSFGKGEDSGTTASHEAIYEIHSEEGYTIITLTYVKTVQNAECCKLNDVNVYNSDASVYVDAYIAIEKLSKTVLKVIIGILIILAGLIVFLVRRSRRKRANL